MATGDVPPYHELLWPALQAVAELGGSASISEIVETVIKREGFSDAQQAVLHNDGPETYYRIQIPVSNDLAQSDQLDTVTVTIDWNASLGVGCLAFPVYYGLSDHVILTKSGNLVSASVKASSGGFTGFMFQASGSLHEYCTSGKLTFTFDPGLIIEPNSTALIYADVPKLINATTTHVQMQPEAKPIVKNGHIVADAT
jgi:hypothetical protein